MEFTDPLKDRPEFKECLLRLASAIAAGKVETREHLQRLLRDAMIIQHHLIFLHQRLEESEIRETPKGDAYLLDLQKIQDGVAKLLS
jgi:hypothetical protein